MARTPTSLSPPGTPRATSAWSFLDSPSARSDATLLVDGPSPTASPPPPSSRASSISPSSPASLCDAGAATPRQEQTPEPDQDPDLEPATPAMKYREMAPSPSPAPLALRLRMILPTPRPPGHILSRLKSETDSDEGSPTPDRGPSLAAEAEKERSESPPRHLPNSRDQSPLSEAALTPKAGSRSAGKRPEPTTPLALLAGFQLPVESPSSPSQWHYTPGGTKRKLPSEPLSPSKRREFISSPSKRVEALPPLAEVSEIRTRGERKASVSNSRPIRACRTRRTRSMAM